jgi:hypothetical protein
LIGEDGDFYTALDYSFSNEVFPGSTYKFRIQARNNHGWGNWSPVVIILSIGIPDKPAPPSTAMNNIFVRISLIDPDYNFEAIDNYDIRIGQSDELTFTQELTYCSGSNATIKLRKYCEILLSVLSSNSYPFKLVAGTVIAAKFTAHNANGWSRFSDSNT